MEKYTITQFRNDYPNDDACLDKIWQVRFSNLVCPKCEKEKTYSKVNDKRSYQCSSCSHQIYPTAGTVFEKTSIPLTHWFYAIYLQTTTRNGVAAKELERQLSVCYKTALRMAHQIKKLMASDSIELLSGTIEADETLIGGLEKNKHMKDRINQTEKGKRTRKRQHVKKPIVLGMLQRGGKVKTFVIKNTSADIMQPLIRKNVEPNSRLITDAHKSYIELKHDYYHISIKHTMDNYVTYGGVGCFSFFPFGMEQSYDSLLHLGLNNAAMPEITITELGKTVTLESKTPKVFKFTTFKTHELDNPYDLCVWISNDIKQEWKNKFECDKKTWMMDGKCVINSTEIPIHGQLFIKLTSLRNKIHGEVKIEYRATKNNPKPH